MKKKICIILVAIMVLQTFSILGTSVIGEEIKESKNENLNDFVPGEVIVKFKQGFGQNKIDKLISSNGLSNKYKSKHSDFHVLKVPENRYSEVINTLSNNPNVEFAEPNYYAKICYTPNDPYFSYQWHLQGYDDGGLDMVDAWDISTGSGATVAIIDTGISQGTDLVDTCFVDGYDFVNGDSNPDDDNGHGTHVAGTVAQSTNNNVGVCGVAFDCCLMAVKVLNSYGSGTYADIIDGINFATNNGADVISMSLEGSQPSSGMEDALENAYNSGVTCIAASGNSGQNGVAYPAAYDDYVIAVGATQYDKSRAPYSNYGSSLDIVAPGGNLNLDQNGDGYGDGVLQQTFTTSWWGGKSWSYYFFQGTSMATPHVSGVAALLYSEGVTNPDDVREAIEQTAYDLGSNGWDMYYGYGLVNVVSALEYSSGGGDSDPTCEITAPSNGATVTGIVGIEVTATDDFGVDKVEFYVDSSLIGTDYSTPYTWSWDSTTVPDGSHTIIATAYDTSSQTTSDSINVIVDNINDPPVANAGPDKFSYVDEIITFDGSGSYDPDGIIVSYAWTFGDGESGSGEVVTHSYDSVGTYTVSLTVTDDDGATDIDYATVTIEDMPSEVVEFEDSFEVSEWNGLWTEDSQNDWFRSTHRSSHGSYAAEVDGSANDATLTMASSIDLSGKSSATLTYSWYIERGWDTGEYIALDVYDGSWQQVAILRGNVDPEGVWHHETIDLTSYMNSDFKIRFRAKVSRSNEDGHVDNVKIISNT